MYIIVHFSPCIALSYKSTQATTVPDSAAVPHSTCTSSYPLTVTPYSLFEARLQDIVTSNPSTTIRLQLRHASSPITLTSPASLTRFLPS